MMLSAQSMLACARGVSDLTNTFSCCDLIGNQLLEYKRSMDGPSCFMHASSYHEDVLFW